MHPKLTSLLNLERLGTKKLLNCAYYLRHVCVRVYLFISPHATTRKPLNVYLLNLTWKVTFKNVNKLQFQLESGKQQHILYMEIHSACVPA
jgi:hypothetical protein